MKNFYGITYDEFKENIYAFLKSYFSIKNIILDLKIVEKEKIKKLYKYDSIFLKTALVKVYENPEKKEFAFVINPDNYNRIHAIFCNDNLSQEELQNIFELLFLLNEAEKDFSEWHVKYFLDYLYFEFKSKEFEGITENMKKLLNFYHNKIDHILDDYNL